METGKSPSPFERVCELSMWWGSCRVCPSIWNPPQIPTIQVFCRAWARISISHPCARMKARSLEVFLDPGMMMTWVFLGMGLCGLTRETWTWGSSRRGSISSKFAICGHRGTAIWRVDSEVGKDFSGDSRAIESSAGSWEAFWNQGSMPRDSQDVCWERVRRAGEKRSGFPLNLLMMNPLTSFCSMGERRAWVPMRDAMTPPLWISPSRMTGAWTWQANPMLAISFFLRLVSAGLPAPSTSMRSVLC